MGIQLTAGQRCILNILQQKLIKTIQAHKELSLKCQESRRELDIAILNTDGANETNNKEEEPTSKNNIEESKSTDEIIKQIISDESALLLLRNKIERISARQKRFTNEVLSGNGNNTIPKDNYLRALGLITKDALGKIHQKSGERRRRTTANPRFSHEAIQAKRALENHNESSSRHTNGTKTRIKEGSSSRLPTRRSASQKLNNNGRRSCDKAEEGKNPTNVLESGNEIDKASRKSQSLDEVNHDPSNGRTNNNVQKPKTTSNSDKNLNATNANIINSIGGCLSKREKQQLQLQFNLLESQIFSRVDQISETRKVNMHLEEENTMIKKRYTDQVNLFNRLCSEGDICATPLAKLDDVPSDLTRSRESGIESRAMTLNGRQEPPDSHDIWMKLKCDESLDGIESSDNLFEQ